MLLQEPSWAHEIMSALMWFWFQMHNINSSSQTRSSFMLKQPYVTEMCAVPLWRWVRGVIKEHLLSVNVLLGTLFWQLKSSKTTVKNQDILVRWWPSWAGLQLIAEEVAVVGLQVNFHRKMIAHLKSLKCHWKNKINVQFTYISELKKSVFVTCLPPPLWGGNSL